MADTNDSETQRDPAAAAPAEPAPGRPGEPAAASAGGAAEIDPAARIADLEAEVAHLDDAWKRAAAETENLRRRTAREKIDERKYAVTQFARDLLPVADNLSRALAAVDPAARSADPALESLIVGVEMTAKVLAGALERHGVTPIPAEGERFDPHVHEAMFEIPDPTVAAGTVLQVLETGYCIHDRPLRPARVGIAKGGPKPEPVAAEAAAVAAEDSGAGSGAGSGGESAGGRTSAYDRSGDGSSDPAGRRVDEKL